MSSRFSLFFLSVLTPLWLTACASGPKAPNPGLKESFHTEISANGSKRFTYSLEMAAPQLRGPYTQQPTRRGDMAMGANRRRGNGRSGVDIDHALNLKLRESGFCRDGFFVIDRVVSRLGGEVRGECREGVER